jgi:DNA-binding IclR family transcriptional regulator
MARLHDHDMMCLTFLAPRSKGSRLTPQMRLIAMTMLLWFKDWDRTTMDSESIADRTGLPVSVVDKTLLQMVQYRMVEEMADGWKPTFERFRKEMLPHWYHRHEPVRDASVPA